MTVPPVRLLVVSPVRDEAVHAERLARSVMAQTRAPDLWLVADDDSADDTVDVVRRAAAHYPRLEVVSIAPRASGRDNEARLAHAAEARAFNRAVASVGGGREFTHVAKLDGDIELPPDYYARVLDEFARDPSLGIAGGRFAEPAQGGWQTVREPLSHVPGALKVYRRDCLEALGGLHERLGWDTLDETRARMMGFTTRGIPDLVAWHHRPMGSVGSRVRGRARYGACAHGAAYPVAWVVLRSLKVATQRPRGISGLAFLYGYARAARDPSSDSHDKDLRQFVRAELRDRLTRRGAQVRARSAR